jgi:hypothetical protein
MVTGKMFFGDAVDDRCPDLIIAGEVVGFAV